MTEARPLRVLLADDHLVVRTGLQALLEDERELVVVGEATDGDDAVEQAAALNVDVVLMDLRMPGTDGIEATARLAVRAPRVRVVVLTTYADDDDVLRALEAGARGYVLKTADAATLVRAVTSAVAGGMVLAPEVAARLAARVREPAPAVVEGLSDREVEVLTGAAHGLTNAEIGRRLYISEATVKTHLQRTFHKLGVRDRTAAVTTALRRGLLPPVA